MEFNEQISNWALGDSLQGKLMLAAGIIALIASVVIFRGENSMLKGMLIPLGLIVILGGGYGGFLSFSRPGHLINATDMYKEKPQLVIEQELVKANRDNRNYSMIIKIWPVLIVIAALLLFVFQDDFKRGLLIGVLILFVFGLIVDTFLHQRLEPYLHFLQQLSKN